MTPASNGDGAPKVTYMEWVAEQIRASPWYVGDGGFIAQAMNAETIEAATETGELWKGQDSTGTTYRWLSAVFADSDLEGALPFFIIADVVDTETGEVGKMTCGGARVIATMFRANQKAWFPFEASLVEVDLGGARAALNLVVAPKKVKNETKG
jgi:hypothetical protein